LLVTENWSETADLATAALPPAVTVGPNSPVSLQFSVTNNGPDLATGTQVTITPSSDYPIAQAAPSSGSCAGAGPIVCTIGDLPAGGAVTIQLQLTSPNLGPGTVNANAAANQISQTLAMSSVTITDTGTRVLIPAAGVTATLD
jgi:hypothetical protein